MSWIEAADQTDLPEIFRVLSINSQALDVVRQLNEGLAFGNSTLSRVQEEAIATVVSVANHCRYGALTHAAFLRRCSGDSELASRILNDYTTADFSGKDRLMLDFAVRTTLEPAGLTQSEVDRLKAAGFEDKDIVSVVLVTCLFNFMNRVASSLGVEVPRNFQRSIEGWLTGPARQLNWLLYPEIVGPQAQPDGPTAIRVTTEEAAETAEIIKIVTHDEFSAVNGRIPMVEPQEEVPAQTDVTLRLPEVHQSLQRFVDECCVVSPEEAATARDLYIGYIRWCDENQ